MIARNFTLDPQLDASTILVHDLPLCQVRLKNDRRFPWLVLIPRQENLVEVFDLSHTDQLLLWSEIGTIAKLMHQKYDADKMNIEILGNKVRQLHIHIIARYKADAAWPNSILNFGTAEPYGSDELPTIIAGLGF
ncbi:MAG: HIT domain-containing protein [Alphaproteobacteria bacterium]|jgi:diadenosine tetraphosphate (Ap4A) HIT family hydrolase|nr:HIT domain-containing protein [Alphaproteobacteria bacterium]